MDEQLARLAVGLLVVVGVVALFFGIGLAMAIYRAKTKKGEGSSPEEK
jgi:hypothetical protein